MAAAHVGLVRQVAAMKQNCSPTYGSECKDNAWQLQINGALGEICVARVLNVYWDGSVNTFKSGQDVSNYQVRTRSSHKYDLLVRPDDKPDDIFILVTGLCPDYTVWGWIKGEEAQESEYIQTYGGRAPAYFVPKDRLNSIEDIPR